jgi:hypothetical protein
MDLASSAIERNDCALSGSRPEGGEKTFSQNHD